MISKGYNNIIMIIDKLNKRVIVNSLKDINIKLIIKWFLYYYYLYHFLLRAIILDRRI